MSASYIRGHRGIGKTQGLVDGGCTGPDPEVCAQRVGHAENLTRGADQHALSGTVNRRLRGSAG